MLQNNFYMVLPSNSCPLIHPDNTSTYFKIDLQTPIELEGQWEAALSELSIFYLQHVSLHNRSISYWVKEVSSYDFRLAKNDNIVFLSPLSKDGKTLENHGVTVKISYGVMIFNWSNKIDEEFKVKFHSLESAKFYGFESQEVESCTGYLFSPRNVSTEKDNSLDKITITFTKCIEHKVNFDEKLKLNDLEHLRTHILEKMSLLFSSITLKNQMLTFTLKKEVFRVRFDDKLRDILSIPHGYNYNVFESGPVIIFERSNYQIFVYTDLIDSIIVGDTKAPLLRTIWIEPKHVSNRVTHVTCQQPMYLPLSKNSINNIEFNLRHDSGEIIAFADKTKSVLTIHCRQIK